MDQIFWKYQLAVLLSIHNFYLHFTKVTRKCECFDHIVEPCVYKFYHRKNIPFLFQLTSPIFDFIENLFHQHFLKIFSLVYMDNQYLFSYFCEIAVWQNIQVGGHSTMFYHSFILPLHKSFTKQDVVQQSGILNPCFLWNIGYRSLKLFRVLGIIAYNIQPYTIIINKASIL